MVEAVNAFLKKVTSLSSLPPWADGDLSSDLVNLRARGEGQGVEYIATFPQQAHELAKEIAAFATSNTGMILLGVADDGTLIGLNDVEGSIPRDQLMRRVEGICNGSIKPAVTPRASWAIEDGRVVLVIVIPKGSEPLYYSNGRPYLRHLSSSRPAEPHEVIDIVRNHLATQPSEDGSTESAFYTELASILASVMLWTEVDSDERWVNPWLTEWMTDSAHAATAIRELAATDAAVSLSMRDRLLELANTLEEASDFTLTIGSGHALVELNDRIRALAAALKTNTVDKLTVPASLLNEGRQIAIKTLRRLTELADRAPVAVEGGSVEQIQAECGQIGTLLMKLSFYNLDGLKAGFSRGLREVGVELRLIEIERLYMDGGESLKRVVEGIKSSQQALERLMAEV